MNEAVRTEDPKVIKPFGSSDPVFPTEKISRNSYGDISQRTTVPGITKREWFAAMAMQAIEASNPPAGYEDIAVSAVKQADALLKELAK